MQLPRSIAITFAVLTCTETCSFADNPISILRLEKANQIEVTLSLSPDQAKFIRETFDDASKILTLSVCHDDGTLGPPVYAKWEWKEQQLVLKPRYRLSPGVTYVVRARLGDKHWVERSFINPVETLNTLPKVLAVYPSASTLPANCLKFYIQFDQPMRQGAAVFEHIRIMDSSGAIVSDPWRRAELWNLEGDRITMWIHPGRIKQGVNLRSDFGPVLKPNQKYKLVVSRELKNLSGISLAKEYVKQFSTSAPDHTRPNPANWIVSPVTPNTRSPLTAKLDEPLDQALLERFVKVETHADSKRQTIDGAIVVIDNGKTWTFTPHDPWPDSPLVLQINERLEDLAGNTPARVFDSDLTEGKQATPTLALSVKSAATPD